MTSDKQLQSNLNWGQYFTDKMFSKTKQRALTIEISSELGQLFNYSQVDPCFVRGLDGHDPGEGDLSTIYNEDQTLTDSFKGINTTDSAEMRKFMTDFIASY